MAENEGMELENKDLEQVSGGGYVGDVVKCKKCGSSNVTDEMGYNGTAVMVRYTCHDCGYRWEDGMAIG